MVGVLVEMRQHSGRQPKAVQKACNTTTRPYSQTATRTRQITVRSRVTAAKTSLVAIGARQVKLSIALLAGELDRPAIPLRVIISELAVIRKKVGVTSHSDCTAIPTSVTGRPLPDERTAVSETQVLQPQQRRRGSFGVIARVEDYCSVKLLAIDNTAERVGCPLRRLGLSSSVIGARKALARRYAGILGRRSHIVYGRYAAQFNDTCDGRQLSA